MTSFEIMPYLVCAFNELFERDGKLFQLGTRGISEQTLTFRLGYYLQQRFLDYSVDCEYNRYKDELKNDPNVDQKWMKPDVIVHHRTEKGENLIVIEAKKAKQWNAGWSKVESKLKAFTRRPGKYEYQIGLAWRIAESAEPLKHDAVWFANGSEIAKTKLSEFGTEVQGALDPPMKAE